MARWLAAAALVVGFGAGAILGFAVLAVTPRMPGVVVAADEPVQVASVQLVAPEPTVMAPEPAVELPAVVEPVAAPQPPPAPPPAPKKPAPPRPKDAYLGLRYDIDRDREDLAARRDAGQNVYEDALAVFQRRLPAVIDSWKGTRWSYSGTTQTPKKGAIACGYFVSTVLLHAGFDVDRVDLARQASEQIVRTLVPDPLIERFYRQSRDTVVKRVEALGRGVYLVGLDTHIGFLVNAEKSSVKFCHSTKRNRRAGVVCETARSSPSLESKYTVLGKLGAPELVDAWLSRSELPSARKNQAQPGVIAYRGAPSPQPAFSPLSLGLTLTPGTLSR